MSELDFKKQLLINEFKTLSKGKNNDEILHSSPAFHFLKMTFT